MGFREEMAKANAKRRQDMAAARERMAEAREQFGADMADARAELDAGLSAAREAGEPETFLTRRRVVAEMAGVKLYRDSIEYGGEYRPLRGVSARVVQEPILTVMPGAPRVSKVYLMVTGPDFEWAVSCGVTPVASPIRVRLFARRIGKTAP